MKRFTGLTLCVDYSDVLRITIRNAQHFDDYVIVTHERDTRTIDLCKLHDVNYVCSAKLLPGGGAFLKAEALNEALDKLAANAWVAVLDADILLPKDFREQLDACNLQSGILYGVKGRQICLDIVEAELMRDAVSWQLLERCKLPLGYFQLFYSGLEPNRFPEGLVKDASTYDMVFAEAFTQARWGILPISVLHLGPVGENWSGRKTPWMKQVRRTRYDRIEGEEPEELTRVFAASRGHICVIGIRSYERVRALVSLGCKFVFIDVTEFLRQANMTCETTIYQARRDRMEKLGVTVLEASDEIGVTLAPLEVCGFILDIDLSPEQYESFIETFIASYKKSWIAGRYWNPPNCKGAALSIGWYFGPPARVFRNGLWLQQVRGCGRPRIVRASQLTIAIVHRDCNTAGFTELIMALGQWEVQIIVYAFRRYDSVLHMWASGAGCEVMWDATVGDLSSMRTAVLSIVQRTTGPVLCLPANARFQGDLNGLVDDARDSHLIWKREGPEHLLVGKEYLLAVPGDAPTDNGLSPHLSIEKPCAGVWQQYLFTDVAQYSLTPLKRLRGFRTRMMFAVRCNRKFLVILVESNGQSAGTCEAWKWLEDGAPAKTRRIKVQQEDEVASKIAASIAKYFGSTEITHAVVIGSKIRFHPHTRLFCSPKWLSIDGAGNKSLADWRKAPHDAVLLLKLQAAHVLVSGAQPTNYLEVTLADLGLASEE
jgi:hypothetical protein